MPKEQQRGTRQTNEAQHQHFSLTERNKRTRLAFYQNKEEYHNSPLFVFVAYPLVYESVKKMDLVGGRDMVESDGNHGEDHLIEPNHLRLNGNGNENGVEEGDALGNTR